MDFVILAVVDLLWEVIDLRKKQVVYEAVLNLYDFVDTVLDLFWSKRRVLGNVVKIGEKDLNMLWNRNPLFGLKWVEKFLLKQI